MRLIILIAFTSAFWISCTLKSKSYFKPQNSAILNSVVGQRLVNQYSRDDIEDVQGYWPIGGRDVKALENNFRKVTDLKVSYDQMLPLEKYAFQYVGVIIKGKRFIYINAFPVPMAETIRPDRKDWTKQPIIFTDGGNGFWGVLFDVEEQTFCQLSINGSA